MLDFDLEKMPRVSAIINDKEYRKLVFRLTDKEKNREFCKHGFEHFLSVARIAMLLNLEYGTDIEPEIVYAAALLHDIGRVEEIEKDIEHEVASARLAPGFLRRAKFDVDETERIISAILNHRNEEAANKRPLDTLIFRADKLSRNCFMCGKTEKCNKSDNKRNTELNI